ncbi:CAP domain-containing protein [Roseovarius sp. 2305UL8-3]|uniref:CAP domain-containing protein n=1 Tax=Roseovarius conchicola TaxID=3121636 RepID=UPI0035290723
MGLVRMLALMGACVMGLAGCLGAPAKPALDAPGGPAQLVDVSAREAQALNALRARYGLPALGTDPVLVQIARGHGQDMLTNGFFGHVSSDGASIADRARAGGYAFCHVAENLAMGHVTFDHVMRQWMTSPSHRSNLLHKNVDDFGLVQGPGNLWVLVLGRPGC